MESAANISENSEFVAINRKAYPVFRTYLEKFQTFHTLENEELDDTLRLLFSAINFCFWSFDESQSQNTRKVKDRLRTIYDAWGLEGIKNFTDKQLTVLLQGLYLTNERRMFIQETISFIEYINFDFVGYLNKFKNLKDLVEDLVTRMPQYNDVSVHPTGKVYFYKRVQALIYSYRKQITSFDVTDELTALADYRIPQFLNSIGILDYSPELQQRIALGAEIKAGTQEEAEIRANTIQVIQELSQEFSIKPSDLDSIIWNASRELTDRKPHHRTITTSY